ncbi:MAG TPA: hypothetical protein VFX23_01730 [Limnobacter sp.]|nr:hypothetical protein [Limnobacter sp.]
MPAKKQIPKHIDEGDAQWIALAPNLYKVCGVPFIEPTDRFVQKYLNESTAALKAVSDEKLLPLAQKCLGYLK